MTVAAEQLPAQIAREFVKVLVEWLTADEMAEVRRLNAAERNPNVCHTHDFCDSNMAMEPAFTKVVGRAPDVSSDADTNLWWEAWDAAKTLYLTDPPAQQALVDEDNTHVYNWTISGVISSSAHPGADPLALRKAIAGLALDWLQNVLGDRAEDELANNDFLFKIEHLESYPDE